MKKLLIFLVILTASAQDSWQTIGTMTDINKKDIIYHQVRTISTNGTDYNFTRDIEVSKRIFGRFHTNLVRLEVKTNLIQTIPLSSEARKSLIESNRSAGIAIWPEPPNK